MIRIGYLPIGIIHSPFKEQEGMPIQPAAARGIPGWIEINAAYEEGLKNISMFSHIILLYHFHRSQGYDLTVTPFLDHVPRGLFATRAPRRPNPIGLSIVKLVRSEGKILHIEDVDIVDETPLLDIKPYVPAFDIVAEATSGWVRAKAEQVCHTRADDRFSKKTKLSTEKG
ncbi:MAG TPA: tRNA (N6-threonylcarbamoyladenosine(37)-N6)-methyltransferase TrmO [Syntrophales bacterium]|jgi:tRNA-Thr(GGU) m(6)t(6)A37 methyltransferase TsaA|nr:tRNA (N6-threonylcarbamoyladenosine(37)-N6)-methyltransferase TrmO [Syntrophales bacterium]HOU78209.1 tRNA (N6-threonylcarbamoyladenosine(37)-N6)-methyltransferase TrmO [Syntrophales bacterium]HPC33863.1 tRNA (N6-threonylcarbamoyladenosine(37)-N6)-methyltransferase TrmO [Syntrophales bacterium]HQG33434.1 tRNA (N6-threonylcarbamoyladenosine(37)-N6)-methyltransferase TrmO [Syntrophales bacterium]HQI35695.1 tRNA (N6-threonylcarbamoyladenosine(37)-N6)-methyltransferase TrmO [Syntrophales bacteri